jgi:hypothetical protein
MMNETEPIPARCAWHTEEIEAMKERTAKHQELIAALVSDMRLLTTRIPENLAVTLNTLQLKVGQCIEAVSAVDRKVSEGYVRVEEFRAHVERYQLIEKMVFGTVALICITVLTAIIYTVVRKGGV